MLIDLKLKDFVAEVASSSPAPGGGSVAAMSAAVGAGLISMLANLTRDKKGYENVHAEMANLADFCEEKSREFLAVIDEDTAAFDVYMNAIRLPKDTDEQKAARSIAIQKAAIGAAEVPLNLARNAFKLIEKAEYAIKNGNKNATSDGCVALLMLRAGILGALYNVRINLSGIRDETYVAQTTREVDEIERQANELEKRILSAVVL